MIPQHRDVTARTRTYRALLLVAFLGFPASLHPRAAERDTQLLDAVKANDAAAARALMKLGASPNAADPDGTSVLHWATRVDNLDLVRALITAGAKASAANRYGVTPLSLAATNGNAATTRLLLDAGADANASFGQGETVLMTASRTGKPDPVAMLIARGANVHAKERVFGETALMWAAGHDNADVVRLLLKAGADPNVRSAVLEFPKVKVDLATMVTTALPRGGLTALMYAAREGALEATTALADGGADLDAVDPDGLSAIVIATINVHFDVAARLAEKGANPNIADSAGMAALYAAVDIAHADPLINRPPAKPSGRLTAPDLVTVLLKRGANPNQPLKAPLLMRQHSTGDASLGDGATPLMRAVKAGDLALMRILLDHGANPSSSLKNQTTTLMMVLSARGGRGLTPESPGYQAIELLLDRGADVNAANGAGETVLHQAVSRGDAIVRLLTMRGARVDVRDKQGRTPLDVALGAAGTGGGAARGRGGRAGGPAAPAAPASESTVKLLRELMAAAPQP